LPIQLISILLLSLGLYLEGGMAKEAEWQLKVKEMETKVAQSEIKSEKVNTQIVTKVVTKKQIIKEKGDDIIKYIDREIVKYDNTCPIPEIVINVHNAAAKNDTKLLKALEESLVIVPVEVHNELAKSAMKLPKK
jgi:hypothetical protein